MNPPDALSPKPSGPNLSGLIQLALDLGMSGARTIPPRSIVVKKSLAVLCQTPQCDNYGASANCPPHTGGPDWFIEMLGQYEHALALKLDAPSKALFSSQAREIFGFLQQTAAQIEQAAIEQGFAHSRAFAGGSCKKAFCADHGKCQALDQGGPCRNPDKARPSMSGFGVDVASLMRQAGWDMVLADPEGRDAGNGTAPVCALVLIG